MTKERIIPGVLPGWSSWEEIMRLALALAREADASGEVPVGALLLDTRGNILGRGFNQCVSLNDPTAHAEIMALRAAGALVGNYRLNGTCLVATLEPCQMCAGALVQARVGGLVYGARDSRAGAVESCLDGLDQYFHNHRVWHCGGILEQDCARLLRGMFRPEKKAAAPLRGQPDS
ncbi:MAG: tRNA adenosine(34) deaminase TadA [Deltaproteobacteria bacterium]|jgi:tRNA(adenine34) deaminase|nr:tRNA adenosine(34) deaminase TadA [Deltaproteobacteria bacterium]